MTEGINHANHNYEMCVSKGAPAAINSEGKLDCRTGAQLGESEGGLSDEFGRLTKSDYLYVDMDLSQEIDQNRLAPGDEL
jgi:hypothetical protein